MREVNHRSKNLLSVIQAIARQTTRHDNPATFTERLLGRIAALTANQDLLIQNEWNGVGVLELVTAQLGHNKDAIGTRLTLQGAPLVLTPAAAQALGMALHELVSNARAYGALSIDSGCVQVEWTVSQGRASIFRISWRETRGPHVEPPKNSGFGQMLIGPMVERSCNGTVKLSSRWAYLGAQCTDWEHATVRQMIVGHKKGAGVPGRGVGDGAAVLRVERGP